MNGTSRKAIAGATQLCRGEQNDAMTDGIPATMSTMLTLSHKGRRKATVLPWPLKPLLALFVIAVLVSCARSSSSARQASPPEVFRAGASQRRCR